MMALSGMASMRPAPNTGVGGGQPATVTRVEAGPRPLPDPAALQKSAKPRLEKLERRGAKAGQRIACARGTRANSGIRGGGISPQARHWTEEQRAQRHEQ